MAETASGDVHAFRWQSPGPMQDLGPGRATSINASGQIVGAVDDAGVERPALWDGDDENVDPSYALQRGWAPSSSTGASTSRPRWRSATTGASPARRSARVSRGVVLEPQEPSDDREAPVTAATLSPAPNVDGWNAGDVAVELEATDAGGSGVRHITHSRGAAPAPGASATASVTEEGATEVRYFATDNAGDVERPAGAVTVRIDRTPLTARVDSITRTPTRPAGAARPRRSRCRARTARPDRASATCGGARRAPGRPARPRSRARRRRCP